MATDTNNTFHPVFSVNNIKNFIPILLDRENEQYASWVELFHIHACAYDVLDHTDTSVPRPPSVDGPTWNRIDAIVKQWIYSTISKDLLQTIIKPGATAQELWTRLEEIFQNDKEKFNSDISDQIIGGLRSTQPPLQSAIHPSALRPPSFADFYETKEGAIPINNYVDFYDMERMAPNYSSRSFYETDEMDQAGDFYKTERMAPSYSSGDFYKRESENGAPQINNNAGMSLVGRKFKRSYQKSP